MAARVLIPPEARGALDSATFARLEGWRLAWYCQQAILAQKAAPRRAVLEWSGEHGPDGTALVDLDLRPFDEAGWLLVRFQGVPLLRLHFTRLLPGAPLDWASTDPIEPGDGASS